MNKPLKIPAQVLHEQYASSNPEASAWVSANAGSGKTHVLTQRVIRLMLAGNAPDRILCLTFTKAAAANMKARVFDTLAKWTMMGDQELIGAIEALTGEKSAHRLKDKARQLFTLALDTPGGLKIQTIHAFCEAILHQFPLEANVPGHFKTLQDAGQAVMLEEAKAYVLSGRSKNEETTTHYRKLIENNSLHAIENAIASIVANRNDFLDWIEAGVEPATEALFGAFDLSTDSTHENVIANCLQYFPLPDPELKIISETAAESDKANDMVMHENLAEALQAKSLQQRFDALKAACLKKDGDPKSESRIVTKFVKERLPDAPTRLVACGEALKDAQQRLHALALIENSRHLFHVAEAVLERYGRLKRRRGVVDFDDLVDKCAALLNRNEITDWIRFRLDRGIDHVLVDEAQDTSPRQWQIVNAVTADFHVGDTAAYRNRTVFVVGDEKQSIYSFQGARPAEFAKQERNLRQSVKSVQKEFHPGKLALSFRSTPDVLHAVDMVFNSETARKGLMQSGETPVHDAVRKNDPGEVLVWPLFIKEKHEASESWLDPVDHASKSDPAALLAERIALTIQEWVGKPLPGSPQPLQYKDILVLVRRRDRLIPALTRTMKDLGLQVAGADRLTLTDHIAVEDLIALAKFALLPSDDLNLAGVLKGVLFNFDEEALFEFAYARGPMSLIGTIENAASDPDHSHHTMAKIVQERLSLLRSKASGLNVFEFFAWVLGPFGMRKAFLARLGAEAEDVLDAFLDECVGFVREGGIDLQEFVSSLEQAKPEVKREIELERDEVRIMTVHASKGLEARVVFLVDPSNAPWSESHRPPVLPINTSQGTANVWLPSSDLHVSETEKATGVVREAAEAEYRRLLYVGMTRAADRLIVCGFRGSNEPKHETWHGMVRSALEPSGEEIRDPEDNIVAIRWKETKDSGEVSDERIALDSDTSGTLSPPPNWLHTRIPHEKPLPSPLTPTGAYALIDDDVDIGGQLSQGAMRGNATFAIQKGKAVHRLLERLPDIPEAEREAIGKQHLKNIGGNWTTNQCEDVWSQVQEILENPYYQAMFSQKSSAEVSLTGKLNTRSGERLITGQIDRLVIQENTVEIIDYKTNYKIPAAPEQVPLQYLTQMALYREMVKQIYPNHAVRSYLLWVHGPNLMKLPDNLLDEAFASIKNI